MPLLDRDAELDLLVEALHDVRGGRLATIVYEGPAGMGKTALAEAAADRAERAGLRVLTAHGAEAGAGEPLGLLRAALEPALAASADDPLAARALARLRAAAAPPELVGADARAAIDGDVRGGLLQLLESGPLALVVEDADAADSASVRVLAGVVRHLRAHPLLLVVTVSHPLGAAAPPQLGELLTDARVRRRRLAPLGPQALAALAAKAGWPADADVLDELARLTGGIPLLVRELLTQGRDLPPDRRAAWLGAQASETVSGVVLRRLGDVAPLDLRVLQLAAVLGQHATRDRLALLHPAGADDVVSAVRRLQHAGVLSRREPLAFTEPVLRDAIVAGLDGEDAATVHGAVAALLDQEAAPPAAVARHLLHSDPAADDDTVRVLRLAAEQALAAGADREAAALLRRALREPPAAAERSPILRELGTIEAREDLATGLRRLEQAAAAAMTPADETAAVIARAQTLINHHRAAEGARLLRAFVDALAARGEHELAMTARIQLMALAQADASARALEREALADHVVLVREHGDRLPLGAFPPAAYELALSGGTAPEVVALIERAWGDGALLEAGYPGWVQACLMLGMVVACDGFALLERILPVLLSHSLTRRAPGATASLLAVRSTMRFMQADIEGAAADAQTGLRLAGEHDMWRGSLARNLLEVALLRDDRAAAREHAGVGLAAPLRHDAFLPFLVVEVRAILRHRDGDHRGALLDLDACRRFEEAWGITNPFPLLWRAHAVGPLLALGRADEARAHAERAVEQASAFRSPRLEAEALRHLVLVTDDRSERRALLARAATTAAGGGARLQEVLARLELGELLLEDGDVPAARDRLGEALQLAHEAGNGPLRDRAYAALVRAGARPRRMSSRGADSLTTAERQAAELAASGLSNKEVAERLFLSVKTVETHLRNAYRKLEITGRPQLLEALSAGRR